MKIFTYSISLNFEESLTMAYTYITENILCEIIMIHLIINDNKQYFY